MNVGEAITAAMREQRAKDLWWWRVWPSRYGLFWLDRSCLAEDWVAPEPVRAE